MSSSGRLSSHLSSWLGEWPASGPTSVIVTASPNRELPGWDGKIRPVAGVATPDGAVLSVPAACVDSVRALGTTLPEIGPRLAEAIDRPGWRFFAGVFRWTEAPIPFDRPGAWVSTSHSDVVPWLKPFNGDVLLGYEDEELAAGVGRKMHNDHGHEVAVVTEEGHRGQGWAKRLVSQAAEQILEDNAVPIYLHAPNNAASARTADASGFPDRGWMVLGLFPGQPG